MSATSADRCVPCPALAKPLYQAVQELESELDWLLRRDASTIEAARVRRVHHVLGRVVGLCRFYPAAHPVHEAGDRLSAVCLPLLADPANAARRKLPEFCFRVMQYLKEQPQCSLQRAVLERVQRFDSELGTGVPVRERSEELLRLIQSLHPFLDAGSAVFPFTGPLPGGSLQNAEAPQRDPLIALLRAMYRLELVALTAPGAGSTLPVTLLLPCLQQQLEAIARLCGASTWTLAYYCESGLGARLHDSRLLAMQCGYSACCALLQDLTAQLLALHLTGNTPADDILQPLLCRLFALMMHDQARRENAEVEPAAKKALADEASSAAGPDAELAGLLAVELDVYRHTLQAWLHGADTRDFQSLDALDRVLYKLQWVYAAAGNEAMQLLAGLAYQLCAQYWFIGLALPAQLLHVLQQLCALILPGQPQQLQPEIGQALQRQLLQAWPGTCSDAGLRIALSPALPDAGALIQEASPIAAPVSQGLSPASAPMVPLAALPTLLSSSFATLAQLPARIHAAGMSAAERSVVAQELALLEKGAAALRIWPLEHLCIQLLAIYALVERRHLSCPLSLLRAAHVRLVAMLDQAAAWQQTLEDQALLTEIQGWLDTQAMQPAVQQTCGTKAMAVPALYDRLQAYVQTLAHAIEKPVRMQFGKSPASLPAAVVLQVENSLKPLLKFILLDNAATGPGRRALHKPLISSICVDMRKTAHELRVHVFEDGPGAPPGAQQLQQLQRRLPCDASPLSSTAQAGHGRSFHFRLPLGATTDAQAR